MVKWLERSLDLGDLGSIPILPHCFFSLWMYEGRAKMRTCLFKIVFCQRTRREINLNSFGFLLDYQIIAERPYLTISQEINMSY